MLRLTIFAGAHCLDGDMNAGVEIRAIDAMHN